MTDSRGLIRSADRAAADMMRASRRDLVGQSLSDWLAPEDGAILQSQLRRLEQSECGLEWETTLAPKGLRNVSAWLTVFALREASGHMAAVHWIIRDLSAWKRQEAGDRLLQDLGEHVLNGLSLPHILSWLCERLMGLVPCPLVRAATRGAGDAFTCVQAGESRFHAEPSCHEWTSDERRELESVLDTHETLHRQEERHQAGESNQGAGRYPSRLLVPLCAQGRAAGALAVYGARQEPFDPRTIQWLETLARRVTPFIAIHQDMTVCKEMEARVFHLAHHDPLTDLPNRTLFDDRLKQALAHAKRHGRGVGVLFVDLDHFKAINDSLGHETGDALLKIVADRLTDCVRATDTVARLSGDEFAVILQDVNREQDAGRVARHVLEAVRQPAVVSGRRMQTTASVGIAMYPFHAADPGVLMARADQAMYRAKEKGGHCCHFVSDAMSV